MTSELSVIRPTEETETREPVPERRFRIYNVGIAKTGTTSIAGIFGRYRSAHEFMFAETVQKISAWKQGALSTESLRDFVLLRDRRGGLELDSASFNHHFIPILVEEFPDSKFIFSIRDCYSWLDSIVTMGVSAGTEVPAWMMEYGRFLASDRVERSAITAPFDLMRALPDLVDGLFRYWSEMSSAVLDLLPPGRSLIVRTHEISASLDRLALFAGVPRDTLTAAAMHRNKAARRLEVLASLEPGLIQKRYDTHCRELMERIFPDFRLDPGSGWTRRRE